MAQLASTFIFKSNFSVKSVKTVNSILCFFFQLSELHIYMVPVDAWQKRRGLAEKDIVENCISLGFVR